jgi:predicted nucleotidyltransferase
LTLRFVPPERPLDPTVVEILKSVQAVAQEAGIEAMLVGATARDVLLTHVFGLANPRATQDVDLAIAVADWLEFEQIRAQILRQGNFRESPKISHRLICQGYPLDLVPFGGLADESHRIAWPPDMAVIMNVAGYAEAYAHAELVQVSDEIQIKVASVAGLALLKLLAWADRRKLTQKDAQDLYYLMTNYADAGNTPRLWETDFDLLELADHDWELASCALLGRDAARMANANTLDQMCSILENNFQRLADDMTRSVRFDPGADALVELRLRRFQMALQSTR